MAVFSSVESLSVLIYSSHLFLLPLLPGGGPKQNALLKGCFLSQFDPPTCRTLPRPRGPLRATARLLSIPSPSSTRLSCQHDSAILKDWLSHPAKPTSWGFGQAPLSMQNDPAGLRPPASGNFTKLPEPAGRHQRPACMSLPV